MTIIKPITDLRNTNAISELCHKSKDPVFITKNGYGDMVIMSMDAYEAMTAQIQALAAAVSTGVQAAAQQAAPPPAAAAQAQATPASPVQQGLPPVQAQQAALPFFTRDSEPESDERTPEEDFGGLRVIREKYLKTKMGPLPVR